jgi:hypothetical protein
MSKRECDKSTVKYGGLRTVALLIDWILGWWCYVISSDKWIMKETEVERVMEKRLCGSLFQFVPLLDRRDVRRRRQIKTVCGLGEYWSG